MEDITMRKIFQYIILAVVTLVMASCTSDIEETTSTTGKNNVQLVLVNFRHSEIHRLVLLVRLMKARLHGLKEMSCFWK